MIRGYHPDKVREHSESERNRPKLEIISSMAIPDRSNEAQLIEAIIGCPETGKPNQKHGLQRVRTSDMLSSYSRNHPSN
jgi:hypothetical protein